MIMIDKIDCVAYIHQDCFAWDTGRLALSDKVLRVGMKEGGGGWGGESAKCSWEYCTQTIAKRGGGGGGGGGGWILSVC